MSKLFVRFSLAVLLGSSFFSAAAGLPVIANGAGFDAELSPSLTINEFTIPTANALPNAITSGPDGNLWFTYSWNQSYSKIGRITTSGVISEFTLPQNGLNMPGIAAGPDGNLWITEYNTSRIGRLTTSGVYTEFPLPTGSNGPSAITSGPDGNLWFTESCGSTFCDGNGKIGRITTTGVITEFPVPTAGSLPEQIAEGPDGNLWFTELYGNKIGRITTTGAITEFQVPTVQGYPDAITKGPDGNVWFTESYKIGRITPAGVITEFQVPTVSSVPADITAGSDGNLWYTVDWGNIIGMITTSGVITEFPEGPAGTGYFNFITEGSDGNLWFTEYNYNKIYQIIVQKPFKYQWNATMSINVTVSGIGSDSDVTSGNLTLYNDGTFNLEDSENGWNYTGTYVYTPGKQKDTVKFTLDQAGITTLKNMLTEWALEDAAAHGDTLSNIDVQFNPPTNLKTTIPKSSNIPSNLTVSIRGRVSAILSGKQMNKTFSYKCGIAFQ